MIKRACGLVCVLVFLAACGGGGSPTSPSQQAFTQSISGNVGVFGTTAHPIGPLPRGGTMTITLQWTGNVDLDLYLTNSTCSEFAILATCQLFGSADGIVNPERITRTVASGEQFRLFVDNVSTTASANYTLSVRVE
jgi:hypothetical protein